MAEARRQKKLIPPAISGTNNQSPTRALGGFASLLAQQVGQLRDIRRDPLRLVFGEQLTSATPKLRVIAYNARVDRFDAIRLLRALVAAGANTRAPMASAWIDKIAVRDTALHGTALASAIAYAEGEHWLSDSPKRKGWIYLTRNGEAVAKGRKKQTGRRQRYV